MPKIYSIKTNFILKSTENYFCRARFKFIKKKTFSDTVYCVCVCVLCAWKTNLLSSYAHFIVEVYFINLNVSISRHFTSKEF